LERQVRDRDATVVGGQPVEAEDAIGALGVDRHHRDAAREAAHDFAEIVPVGHVAIIGRLPRRFLVGLAAGVAREERKQVGVRTQVEAPVVLARRRLDRRARGVAADTDYAGRSLKGQLKQADRAGARYVAILGDEGTALKDMESGEQRVVERDTVMHHITHGL
jgi:hypothetical protein